MRTMYDFRRLESPFNRLAKSALITCAISLGLFSTLNLSAQGCVMACPPPSDPTPISISIDCLDTLNINLLGVVTTNCTGPYTIDIMENGMSLGDTITGEMIGNTYMVVVEALGTPQFCMTAITVLDKLPPQFTCPDDVTVSCFTDLASIPVSTEDDVVDCSPVTINTFDDLIFSGDCDNDIISKYRRTYVVADDYNNITTCTQYICYEAVDLDDVVFPPNFKGNDALHCFPAPDTDPDATGRPTVDGFPIINGQTCNLTATFQDQTAPLCSGGYKIFRLWTVTDWCDGNNSIDSTQIIEVVDLTPPDVDAPDTLTVSAGAGCVADVVFPPADVSEDCGTNITVRVQGFFGTMQGNGGMVEDLPVGTHEVVYVATNDCNREGRDTMIVVVVDDVPPAPICNGDVAIPLNSMGMATVWASAFDGGSYDNCNSVFFKARRMDAPNGYDCFANGNNAYQFDDKVKFCCEDIANNDIMVVLRVYDVEPAEGIVSESHLAGRFTDCMVQVEVQDKVAPEIICPPDITISCMFPFDPENLDVFGTVVTDPADRTEVCIDDPGNPGTIGLECVGLDGLASDNCNVTVEETDVVIIDTLCGIGYIERTFTATDDGGLTASCVQKITIKNFEPFTVNDIVWPLPYTTADICDIDLLDPDDLPAPYNQPVVTTDACDLVTFTHSDVVFDFSDPSQACFKILRTWQVMDWCSFNSSQQTEGLYTHLQVIKVHNTTGPEITSALQDEVICTDDVACGPGNVILSAAAMDDCTNDEILEWRVSIDWDNDDEFDEFSPELTGASVDYPTMLPLGTHRVLFTVWDFCGNITTAEQLIEMRSCKTPSAKCRDLSTTLMPMDSDGDGDPDIAMVTIWASDLDAGSDHVCGNPVTVAFSDNPDDKSRTFMCDDMGANIVELWVIDNNGNTDYCTVTIDIQDNSEACDEVPGNIGLIAGEVHSSEDAAMNEVMVMLDGSGLQPQYTQGAGEYLFPAMPFGGTYTVTPHLDVDHKNGVSTIDLIRIQKHLLGVEYLDSPYKIIAADANGSGNISAVDILNLKKLILGINDDLPGNTSWRFIDANYQFTDPENPLGESFPEAYQIDPFMTNMMEIDFIGVKVGDVNGSANVAALPDGDSQNSGSRQSITLKVKDQVLSKGETHRIPVSIADLDLVETMQFTMQWDTREMEVINIIESGSARADQWNPYRLHQGVLPFSWHKFEHAVLPGEDALLFEVEVRALDNISLQSALTLSSTVTPIEGTDVMGVKVPVRLNFENPATEGKPTLHLYQNIPNPFNSETLISFESGETGAAFLVIHDALGQQVYFEKMNVTKGYHEVRLNVDQLKTSGVLMYTIKTQNAQQTKRMIIDRE